MSVINAVPLLAAGGGDYQISRSVRLRASATAYFNRTPASATNRKTWTWSGWVKRGALSSSILFAAGQVGTQNYTYLQFSSDQLIFDVINAGPAVVGRKYTNAVFRDPSAWYHVVVIWDTTNATAADRMQLYVNNVRQTSFSLSTDPSLNADGWVNAANIHGVGYSAPNPGSYLDGYLTEVNFIDGQQLTPSSFGENDSITGVWKPKKYAGTYGTNGFYLNFSDNSSNTATTIGKDYSGNGNNWTPNNISVTAGVTYDSMLDVPTLWADGGNGRGNYAVASPINYRTTTPAPTITEANLRWVGASTTTSSIGCASFSVESGQWYFEATRIGTNNSFIGFVVGQFNANASSAVDLGAQSNEYAYITNGNKVTGGSSSAYGSSTTANDVIGVALDLSAGTMTFYKNGTTMGTAFSSLPTGSWTPAFDAYQSAGFILNFGQRPFTYTPPTGFKALNTQNLPTPTISNGANYMAATTFTGNVATQTITNTVNGISFQPDLVWLKSRSDASNHTIYDSVRGVNDILYPNLTVAGVFSANNLNSFNSNGFSLGASENSNDRAGESSVGWQWKAGGAAVTNSSGSISSQVSANPTAGFSIVSYTGNGASGATIGHGLGAAPKMVIAKLRNSAGFQWSVYHASLASSSSYLWLNSTAAQATDATYWGAAPTSSVFTVGTNANTNNNTSPFIAYCFAEVAGYSKFGSYTGNGSADGTFVFLGFRPRWVMVKRTDSIESWYLLDTSRSTFNVPTAWLASNLSNAEGTDVIFDILSNGFKQRSTAANASGGTYIFMAFAENPFRNALAR